jgi:hypothetical protein
MQADGPALSASVTATSLIGTTIPKYTLPTNIWTAPGIELRVRGLARLSNLTAAPGTLTLDVRFGSIIVMNGGAIQMSATAHTNVALQFEFSMLLRSIGAGTGGTLFPGGHAESDAFVNFAEALPAGGTAPAVGAGFDTSTTQQVDAFGTFSVNNAANSITLHRLAIDLLQWYP